MQFRPLISSGLACLVWATTVGCQRTADPTQTPEPRQLVDSGASRERAPAAVPDPDRAAGQAPHTTSDASGRTTSERSEPAGQPDRPVGSPAAAPGQTFPPVLLSEQHRHTCRLQVGDQVPSLTLYDVQGTPRELHEFWGSSPTVLVFWTTESAAATEQFLRLSTDIGEPWYQAGVAVVAVHVGGEPSQVEALAPEREHVVSLIDPDGTAFAQFATDILPRTYLIDATGTIRWFDLEYSRSMRRQLNQALSQHRDQ